MVVVQKSFSRKLPNSLPQFFFSPPKIPPYNFFLEVKKFQCMFNKKKRYGQKQGSLPNLFRVQGTVRAISSDPTFNKDNPRFTKVPFKPLIDEEHI